MARIIVLSDVAGSRRFLWRTGPGARVLPDAAKAGAVIVNGGCWRSTDLRVTQRSPSQPPRWGTYARASWPCLATTTWATSPPARILTGCSSMQIGSHDGQLFCHRSLGPGCRRLAPDRCQRAAFRLGPRAGTRTGSVARRAVVYRWAAHRAVPAQASLPRTPDRRCLETRVHGAASWDAVCSTSSIGPTSVSGHLHQHRDRTLAASEHLWVCGAPLPPRRRMAAMVSTAASPCSISHERCRGHNRTAARVDLAQPRPRSRVTAAIEPLRDMPPSPPPHAG